jgi:predicted 2-oxoglutarate/Fe(II)-dependent dioxygenase YbiX|tara:strand:- start:4920 stop:5471 length:552 start_codon:yes stop_codon:yes gene_type:complete
MQLKDCIQVYDHVMAYEHIGGLIKWLNTQKFTAATTVGGINTKIRKAENLGMTNNSKSQTMVHWHNYLHFNFSKYLQDYKTKFPKLSFHNHFDITALKYEKTGHYSYHHDSSWEIMRTMSCILMLNNDYEGGDLSFADQNNKEILKVEKQSNRMIIWPSNFLFPHAVLPVKEGKRYSIVAWAF